MTCKKFGCDQGVARSVSKPFQAGVSSVKHHSFGFWKSLRLAPREEVMFTVKAFTAFWSLRGAPPAVNPQALQRTVAEVDDTVHEFEVGGREMST